MAQFVAFTLNDREPTPVAHTFQPNQSPTSELAVAKRTTGVPVADEIITISNKTSGQKRKIRMLIVLPVVANEVINGISKPSVIRRGIAEVNLTFDDISSLQERKNLVGLLYASLAPGQVMLDATFTGLEGLY